MPIKDIKTLHKLPKLVDAWQEAEKSELFGTQYPFVVR